MIPLLPLGAFAVAVKSINELADKELELQRKYAECLANKVSADARCKPVDSLTTAKAVIGISLLITTAGLFYLFNTNWRE